MIPARGPQTMFLYSFCQYLLKPHVFGCSLGGRACQQVLRAKHLLTMSVQTSLGKSAAAGKRVVIRHVSRYVATVRLTMRVGLFKGGTTSLKRTKDELQREHIFDSLTRGTALRLPRSFTHKHAQPRYPSPGIQTASSHENFVWGPRAGIIFHFAGIFDSRISQ